MALIDRKITYANQFVTPTKATAAGGANGGTALTSTADHYASQFVKLLPSEVVAAYLAADSIIANIPVESQRVNVTVGATVLGLLLTPFYLFTAANVSEKPELVVSTGSFAAWTLLSSRNLCSVLKLDNLSPVIIAIGFSILSPFLLWSLRLVWPSKSNIIPNP